MTDDGALLLETAIDAARRAGELLLEGWDRPNRVRFKGDIDLVTEYDTASEKLLVDALRSEFPDHSIVAEEGGTVQGEGEYCWYVDPLDGTVNFAHGLPFFCVSLACFGPKTRVGVVYEPLRGELFTAVDGRGAQLNGEPIGVSGERDLDRSLLATGFPYYLHDRPDPVLRRFRDMAVRAQGLRRAGSAALDLCYVAAGRFAGFWEEGLKPWDTAAGFILVEEAGGMVTDFSGNAFQLKYKEVLATNGLVHYNILEVLESG